MELPLEQTVLARIDPLLGRDQVIRGALLEAVTGGRVTPHGLALLRDHYALTPAETMVFIRYYLAHGHPGTRTHRRLVANQLCLSENTLMHHVTSIRRKLGIVGRRGSANVLLWCLSSGIVKIESVMPDALALRPIEDA
jgi:hypothetical protein